jgi:hypothetical protein
VPDDEEHHIAEKKRIFDDTSEQAPLLHKKRLSSATFNKNLKGILKKGV